jgi:hypothetical protein
MRIKLNGWQRIGIVLSAVWFIGWVGYTAYIYKEEERKYWTRDEESIFGADATRGCLIRAGVNSQVDPAKWSTAYDNCVYQAHVWFIAKMVALNLGLIVVGWVVALLGVRVQRWIMRGFA